jgi:hypothetical protein
MNKEQRLLGYLGLNIRVVAFLLLLSISLVPTFGKSRTWDDPCPKVWSERKQNLPPKKYWHEPIMKEGVDFEYWPQWKIDITMGYVNNTMAFAVTRHDSLPLPFDNPKIKIAVCEGITGDVLRMTLIHEYAHIRYGWEDHKGAQWIDVRTFTKTYPKGSLPR